MEQLSREQETGQMGFAFPTREPAVRHVWAVAELVSAVRGQVERDHPDVWVEGEISNCRSAPSGHIYCTLKDSAAQLPVVLFRRQASLLRFRPEDGLQVLVRGRVSVYEQRGQLQLIAEFIEPVGAGSLQVAFEQLKQKLLQEGLFAQERKKPLPPFPRSVGIVTSPTGAVIRDFLNVGRRRHLALQVQLYPALVQGDTAAREIAAGIEYFNRSSSVDVIVIARGGGSLEDLQPFNTELVARAIARSVLPIVSAVGHETDFTIADFAADLRAPTPSAAAELVTEAQYKVAETVADLERRLTHACRYTLMQASRRFAQVSADAAFDRLANAIARRRQHLDELAYQLEAGWRQQNRILTENLHRLELRLLRQDVTRRMSAVRERLGTLDGRLLQAGRARIAGLKTVQAAAEARLTSLSPLAVLNRGYALVFNESGVLLKDAARVREGERITARLARGEVTSRVEARPAGDLQGEPDTE